jgi:hypothetical protein
MPLVLLSGLLLMYSYRSCSFPGFPAMARDHAADFFNQKERQTQPSSLIGSHNRAII